MFSRKLRRIHRFFSRFGANRFCICCSKKSAQFLPYGDYPYNLRKDALCPWCGSLERQRLMLHFLLRTGRLQEDSILHFAPEKSLSKYLSSCDKIRYLTADLYAPAMVKEDITQMTFASHRFDLVLCSHVLDHVPKYQQALREIARVLRPNGVALIQSLVNPNDITRDGVPPGAPTRAQGNHCIRVFGHDFATLIANEGFEVEICDEKSFLSPLEIQQYGLSPKHNPNLMEQNTLYVCTPKANS